MSKIKIAYRCLDNPAHAFKSEINNMMEGVTCPVCQYQVLPTGYDELEHNQLPYYYDLKKQCTVSKRKVDVKQY